METFVSWLLDKDLLKVRERWLAFRSLPKGHCQEPLRSNHRFGRQFLWHLSLVKCLAWLLIDYIFTQSPIIHSPSYFRNIRSKNPFSMMKVWSILVELSYFAIFVPGSFSWQVVKHPWRRCHDRFPSPWAADFELKAKVILKPSPYGAHSLFTLTRFLLAISLPCKEGWERGSVGAASGK